MPNAWRRNSKAGTGSIAITTPPQMTPAIAAAPARIGRPSSFSDDP
jgi:hypothetical protein